MSPPILIGLIGCGRVAERFYLSVFSRLREARLVAVADPIPERRELFSNRIQGCMAFSSADALLQKAGVVAVIITTPPATHVAIATQALRNRIHVFVEKPLAPCMTGVEELKKLLAASSSSLMVGFNQRYWEPIRKLRQLVSDHDCSETASAELVMTSDVQAWSPISEMSDPLDDLGSHQLDLLRYIFCRDIIAISARWTNTLAIHMRVRLKGGLLADCVAAHKSVTQDFIHINCGGQQYQIRLGSERIQPACGLNRYVLDLSDRLKRRLLGQRSSLRESYEQQLISFFRFIRRGDTPSPGITDGIAAILAVEAARRSAANDGMEVVI